MTPQQEYKWSRCGITASRIAHSQSPIADEKGQTAYTEAVETHLRRRRQRKLRQARIRHVLRMEYSTFRGRIGGAVLLPLQVVVAWASIWFSADAIGISICRSLLAIGYRLSRLCFGRGAGVRGPRLRMSRPGCIRRSGFVVRHVSAPSLLLLSVVLCGCHSDPKTADVGAAKVTGDTVVMATNSPQLAALTVEPVQPQQPTFVPLTGRLVWDEDATVRIFTPFAGRVRKLFVDLNESVTNGMALAEIQSPDFGQAQADARKAQSELRRAERALTRARDLFEHGAAPRKDVESAEADYAGAQAEEQRAQSRLAIYGATATTQSEGFLLPSPLAGVLVERNVNPGQEVRPDQMLANVPQFTAPLFVVTDPSRLWVWLDVTEMHLPLVHKGTKLTLRSKAFPNQTFHGRLDLIGDSLDPTTRTVRARGTVDNTSDLLKAELYVTVEVPDAVPSSLQVPSRAVFLRENQYYVFLETRPGGYERHAVKVGSEREGKVAILEGLEPGQRLVTEGCLLLQSMMDSAPKS